MPVTPNTFYEPQGASPTIIPVPAATGYCTASDVCAIDKALVPGQGNNPTFLDLNTYIEMIAGQMDAAMLTKGWAVPVNVASHPEVSGLLSWINATGADWMANTALPASPKVDKLEIAFDNAMKMLENGKFSLDVDMDVARSEPRAPFITYIPPCAVFDPTVSAAGDGISSRSGDRKLPYLSRSLRF